MGHHPTRVPPRTSPRRTTQARAWDPADPVLPGELAPRYGSPTATRRARQLPPESPSQLAQPIMAFKDRWRFLSNFYKAGALSVVLVDSGGHDIEMTASTVEHLYQAAKCALGSERIWVLSATSAPDARVRGRQVQMRPDWDLCKIPTMRELIRIKFLDPGLAQALLHTGDRELIEGNTWGDRFWGMTAGTSGPVAYPIRVIAQGAGQRTYHGHNWLGQILMERRAALRKARG